METIRSADVVGEELAMRGRRQTLFALGLVLPWLIPDGTFGALHRPTMVRVWARASSVATLAAEPCFALSGLALLRSSRRTIRRWRGSSNDASRSANHAMPGFWPRPGPSAVAAPSERRNA